MSEEVVQWLAEIRALREELAQCRSERDAAYKSSAHWRELYSTEAQQRRVEARLARENQNRLETEIRQLKTANLPAASENPNDRAALEAEVMAIATMEQLRQKLVAAMQERDRALAALKTEQEEHASTRDNLTAVISDTVEQLSRIKAET